MSPSSATCRARVMGQSQSQNNYKASTTSSTVPARSKPNPDDYTYYVDWEDEKFAEGRFRYAIKGTWVRPREKESSKKLTGILL